MCHELPVGQDLVAVAVGELVMRRDQHLGELLGLQDAVAIRIELEEDLRHTIAKLLHTELAVGISIGRLEVRNRHCFPRGGCGDFDLLGHQMRADCGAGENENPQRRSHIKPPLNF